jgi:cold shock CspA family protein
MRSHGTLKKWNDDRGFGFVVLPQSQEEIFVHISAFPRDDARPSVGETISFEVRRGPDGRKRAEGVARPGARRKSRRDRDAFHGYERRPFRAALAAIALGALGLVGYSAYTSRHNLGDGAMFAIPQSDETTGPRFKCDGRTHCSQMTSCAEAMYFLQNCPNTRMDGNNDGEPCEQQWCN